ncbi:unnamed protein product [Rotaria magnacalcarata]|uniref:SHSP domain-containing protein n=1 Tax=Rotaria magnacalcarata TaxID=392030 RepID=A0A815UW08_9BILA|nr:unnamed protein product [Rotaria magnacalcarata]CAF1647904.1 unnamed protein product [Rotaria magnacalcarata]CAF2045546.1 unnamed protein product [Rotaria magnacalcarata]CAF2057040.1 unnamed protein product [Rotaria magnacalcarata]CAF2137489.1 unnamed protein product [Rotaria magnacalcarata]
MPSMYSTAAFPLLVVANSTDDDDDYMEDDYSFSAISNMTPFPMRALSQFVNVDRQIPPSAPIDNGEQGIFRLRMNVEGFQPNDLNVSIRHGCLIVRGKHVIQAQTQLAQPLTTSSIIDGDEDIGPDFVAKEFQRTFVIPTNADVRKAHALYYPQQQLLVVEIPFQNLTMSSQRRNPPLHIRPMDVFITMIAILLMDRALRITYQQFMFNENSSLGTSSQNRN